MRANPLAALYPPGVEAMPVAWELMRIPGLPPAFALLPDERSHPDPRVSYRRRTIQTLDAAGEHLVLVDKALPHARHDLMLSGVAVPPMPGPDDVPQALGEALWRTALGFVHYVSDPEVQRAYGLSGGRLHLALNCDPNTLDRESCQANKEFHLHLLYWTAAELAPLEHPERLADFSDPYLRRQALDPLAFLGARLIGEALADLDWKLPGAALLPDDPAAVIAGRRPLGCLIQLPGWQVLKDPAFEPLVRRIDRRLTAVAEDLLAAFTGRRDPPSPWRRHPLLPRAEIRANLDRLPWSAEVRAGLQVLATRLHDLPPRLAERLRARAPGPRKHLMALNQPVYSLNLYAPALNTAEAPILDADPVWLILQTKLFSGIGGAGLVSLGAVPSVRILRGEGSFSEACWHERARFQCAFAQFNRERLGGIRGLQAGPVGRLDDLGRGWTLA